MSAPESVVPTTIASDIPKPVIPAEEVTQAPSKALDSIAESSLLDKARDAAKPAYDQYLEKAEPYVNKVSETAKPYADKAQARLEKILDKIEGNDPSTTSTPTSAGTLDKSIDNAAATTTGAAESTTAVAADSGDKAKQYLAQGLSAVQSTFTQLTNTIEQKTTTESHPGFITQVTNAVNKGIDRVEGYLNEPTDASLASQNAAPTSGSAAVAAAAGVPATGATPAIPVAAIPVVTSEPVTSEPVVSTTTNTVPHTATA
ncbi:hypothetical protein B9479_002069 [Cryptococcus floricola]|uniref:Uncharacterized protein n=1 Tax=Cryptococcus floricola TaxID=2591691 RepID=A0A5D3B0M4_9TREE|nr:hypothetical protein B9479_002069 [Cryptococcus floricola]